MGALYPIGFRTILARVFIVALGAGVMSWVLLAGPRLWSDAAVSEIATRMIAGEAYKPDVLDRLEAGLEDRASLLRPAALSKAAVIRLRRAEQAIGSGDREIIEARFDSLHQAIYGALMNAPSDSFFWLVLFWLDNTRNGFTLEHLGNLQMSYMQGASEGWIAVKRNRLAMAIFPTLPADLAEAATSEFVGLVRSQFFDQAADVIAGPAWPIRRALLQRLRELKEADRRSFAKLLYDRDLDDVPVPGIEPPPRRPWEH
jgi:hypothetical protein